MRQSPAPARHVEPEESRLLFNRQPAHVRILHGFYWNWTKDALAYVAQRAKVQCDFSVMISSDMYDEFVKPRIQKQCRQLDYTVYHLDGPDALRHIDSVFSIPELDAAMGTGRRQPAHRRQGLVGHRLEKGLRRRKIRLPARRTRLIKEFGQDGTLIITHTETEDQAKKLMDESLNWGG